MNRKQRPRNRPAPEKSDVPVDVEKNLPGKAQGYLSKHWMDQVAAGTEKGIRDTYAWKDGVRRLGLKEARRRLRLSLLATQYPEFNPRN
jgi:hypothetical protein